MRQPMLGLLSVFQKVWQILQSQCDLSLDMTSIINRRILKQ